MMSRCRFGFAMLMTALTLVISCRRNRRIDAEPNGQDASPGREDNEHTAKWNAWFDSAFQQLPKAAAPPATPSDWVHVRSPDGVRVRLSREYQRRNDSGCWARGREHWPGPGWLDVCVHAAQPSLSSGPGFNLEPRPLDPDISDQVEFDSWRAEGLTFGTRRAIIERAYASGGFIGKRVRSMAVVIELRRGKWAIFWGETGDDTGYDELLSIASTMEAPVP